MPYTTLRFTFAALLLLPWQFGGGRRGKPSAATMTRAATRRGKTEGPAGGSDAVGRSGFRLLAVPAMAFLIFQVCYIFGIDRIPAGVAAVVAGILPVAVAILTALFSMEGFTGRKIFGIAATFGGVVLIAVGNGVGFGGRGAVAWGILLVVVAQFFYGFYTIVLKPATRVYPMTRILFVVFFSCAVVFGAYSVPVYGLEVYLAASPGAIGTAFASSLFAMLLGNVMWGVGVRRIGSLNTSVYGNLPAVFGIAAGMAVLGETLTLLQAGGTLVVIVGIFLVNRAPGRRKRGIGSARGIENHVR